jgi:hypothetical protein
MNKTSNKIQIPIKTKIASIIIFGVGIVASISFLYLFIIIYFGGGTTGECKLLKMYTGFDLCALVNYFVPVLFIIFPAALLSIGISLRFLKKNNWWIGLFVSLLFSLSCFFLMYLMHAFVFYLFVWSILIFVAFALLVLDKKNYFAAVERAKKGEGGAG